MAPCQKGFESFGFLEEVRVLLAAGKGQDRRKVAAQHDRQRVALGNQLDIIDE
ncbi:hypothetical protein [Brucella intermedia]|uniref:hypothetical protein n=1 Tax=Brucella intermedia TaxID=94625 RepID=UPI001FFF238A|nr:hypothetical protein [Brucella intermedia]